MSIPNKDFALFFPILHLPIVAMSTDPLIEMHERLSSALVNKTLTEAEIILRRHDLEWRIVQVNGVGRVVTSDYCPTRANLSVIGLYGRSNLGHRSQNLQSPRVTAVKFF